MNLENYIDKLMNLLAAYAPKVVSAVLVLIIGLWIIKRIAFIANKAFEKIKLNCRCLR